jgi:hypothetical protein
MKIDLRPSTLKLILCFLFFLPNWGLSLGGGFNLIPYLFVQSLCQPLTPLLRELGLYQNGSFGWGGPTPLGMALCGLIYASITYILLSIRLK